MIYQGKYLPRIESIELKTHVRDKNDKKEHHPFSEEHRQDQYVPCVWDRRNKAGKALLLQDLSAANVMGAFPFKRAAESVQCQICRFLF